MIRFLMTRLQTVSVADTSYVTVPVTSDVTVPDTNRFKPMPRLRSPFSKWPDQSTIVDFFTIV